ncbi:hypothetical protein ABZP36_021123 [Zizania latifolia]
MPTGQTSCGKAGRRRRRRRALRGVRLGLLLRLRLRLSGLLGLLVRRVEELRCCPRVGRISCSTAAAAAAMGGRGRRAAPAVRDQSSFYADAIADCLEFIKSRSSCKPEKNAA